MKTATIEQSATAYDELAGAWLELRYRIAPLLQRALEQTPSDVNLIGRLRHDLELAERRRYSLVN